MGDMLGRFSGDHSMLGLLKVGGVPARGVLVGLVVLGWAHQDSNLGPSDYESDALTN